MSTDSTSTPAVESPGATVSDAQHAGHDHAEHDDPTGSPAEIEAEIEATRARLAGTVDELAVRVHPKTVAQRSVADAREKVQTATHTPDGRLRVERLAAVGAAVAALVGLLVWRRARR